jgi:hypothetical protein
MLLLRRLQQDLQLRRRRRLMVLQGEHVAPRV